MSEKKSITRFFYPAYKPNDVVNRLYRTSFKLTFFTVLTISFTSLTGIIQIDPNKIFAFTMLGIPAFTSVVMFVYYLCCNYIPKDISDLYEKERYTMKWFFLCLSALALPLLNVVISRATESHSTSIQMLIIIFTSYMAAISSVLMQRAFLVGGEVY